MLQRNAFANRIKHNDVISHLTHQHVLKLIRTVCWHTSTDYLASTPTPQRRALASRPGLGSCCGLDRQRQVDYGCPDAEQQCTCVSEAVQLFRGNSARVTNGCGRHDLTESGTIQVDPFSGPTSTKYQTVEMAIVTSGNGWAICPPATWLISCGQSE